MILRFLSCFTLLYSFTLTAGGDLLPVGVRFNAMGNAGTSLSDLWSIGGNQAGLAFLKKPGVGIVYANQFLLSQTGTSSVAGVLPVKQGTFGIQVSQHGYSLYKETQSGIAFAKSFGENIGAGVKLSYLQVSQGEEFEKKNLLIAEMGLQARFAKSLVLGVHLFNPNRSKIADYEEERVPTILSLGMHYEFSEKVLVAMAVHKNSFYKADFCTGLEYKVIPEIILRAGFSTFPQTFSFGTGIVLKKIKIDLSSSFHSVLGISPQVGLQYDLK